MKSYYANTMKKSIPYVRRKLLVILGVFLGLFIPSTLGAVQITVPSAPSAGYALVSTSTGAYISTTTDPFHVGSLVATSSSATSTFAGGVTFGNNTIIQQGSGSVVVSRTGSTGVPSFISAGPTNTLGTSHAFDARWNPTSSNEFSSFIIFSNGSLQQFNTAAASTNVLNPNGNSFVNGGNFGVGTTSPFSKLSVVGQVVAANYIATTTATSTLPNINITQGTYGSDFIKDFTGTGLSATAGVLNVTFPSAPCPIGATGSIQYADGVGGCNGTANLFYDNGNDLFGVSSGGNAPDAEGFFDDVGGATGLISRINYFDGSKLYGLLTSGDVALAPTVRLHNLSASNSFQLMNDPSRNFVIGDPAGTTFGVLSYSDFTVFNEVTDNKYGAYFSLDATNEGGSQYAFQATDDDAGQGPGKFVFHDGTTGFDTMLFDTADNVSFPFSLGIGTAGSPTFGLDLQGSARMIGLTLNAGVTQAVCRDGSTNEIYYDPSSSCTGVTPVSSQWTTVGSNIYYNTGNVGIGTSTPAFKSDVNGRMLLEPTASSTTAYKGVLWSDSSVNQLSYNNGNDLYIGGNLFTALADKTINTTSPTSALSPTRKGTTLIKANSLKAGQKFTIWGGGYYSTPIGNTSTVTITTSIASSTATTISNVTTGIFPASASNFPFDFNLQCTVRSIGASGTLVCDGTFNYATALSAVAKTSNSLSTIGTITFNSTVDETLDVKASWSAVTTQSATVQESWIDF